MMATRGGAMNRIALTLGICFLTAISAFADKKDDFKKAASVNGPSCDLIPYDTLNYNCRQDYGKQRDWCTGDKELGCKGLNQENESDRNTAKERRDNAAECYKRRIDVRQRYKDALDKLNSENDPDIQDYVKTLKDKINDSIQKHQDALDDTEKRRDTCDRVYNKRN
jgi:hypothetical protein